MNNIKKNIQRVISEEMETWKPYSKYYPKFARAYEELLINEQPWDVAHNTAVTDVKRKTKHFFGKMEVQWNG